MANNKAESTIPREPVVSPWYVMAEYPFEVAVHGLERGWKLTVALKDRKVQNCTVVAEEPQLRLNFPDGVSEGVLWFFFELRGSPLVTCHLPVRVNPAPIDAGKLVSDRISTIQRERGTPSSDDASST